MAREIGTLQMTDTDPTTVHDEAVTVTIEPGMIGAKETTEGTEPGGIAPDIVTEGTNPAGSILHILTVDGILPPIHPLAHTTGHHVLQSHPIPIEKKASEYRTGAYIWSYLFNTHIPRISPPPPRESTSAHKTAHTKLDSDPTSDIPAPEPAPSAQPELELELVTSPVPIELSLAARRAKRQAILAKYAGVTSVNTTEASPSPGPSSAVQQPPPSAVVSDPQSQRHSVVVENGAGPASRDMSVVPSRESS